LSLDNLLVKSVFTSSFFTLDEGFAIAGVKLHNNNQHEFSAQASKIDPEGSREHRRSFRSVIGGSEWPQQMRKGKNSKSSKLRKIGIIVKSTSQDFQRHKRFVKQIYGSKDIHSQSFGQPSLVSRDESASILLTSASVRMTSVSV
jgi:hypothetical protein